jgi:hypothetical protein
VTPDPYEPAAVARAVLFEGYMLYPYRTSALKNREPSLLGVLRPGAVAPSAGCAVLVIGQPNARIDAQLHFLVSSDSAVEAAAPCAIPFDIDPAEGERVVAFEARGVTGTVTFRSTPVTDRVCELELRITNTTTPAASPNDTGAARSRAMRSAQLLLSARAGTFATPREHPSALAAAAAECRSDGLWPIFLGEPGRRDIVLCSPMILDDHPQIAPESAGDLFDATEIDELLTLRVRTLARDERDEIARGDPRVRAIVDRADALADAELADMHGAARPPAAASARVSRAIRPGDSVRLRPRGRSDIFDLALDGRAATVVSIEQDLDDRTYVSVTIDDDPGQDLGALGQPGHRFYFAPDEVEHGDR